MFLGEKYTSRIGLKILLLIFVICWSFFVINKGFFMDEAGLLSTYKAIYQGNRMFIDSWGPLQMGGLITYPLFELYNSFLSEVLYENGIGFVLYMRICFTIIKLLISIYLYLTIRKTKYKDGAFVASVVYYCFFTSFKNLSYKSICDMAIMLFICWGIRFFIKKKPWYFMLMGLATCVAIVAYPSMIFFPFLMFVYFIYLGVKGYNIRKPIVIYLITCVAVGIAVLAYLQFTSGLINVFSQLPYLEDSAYKSPLYIRLAKILLEYLLFGGIAYLPVLVVALVKKKRYVAEETVAMVLAIYWILFMGGIIVLRPSSLSMSRFLYGFILLFWWCPYLYRNQEHVAGTRIGNYRLPDFCEDQIIGFIIVVSIIAQFTWAFATNQGVAIPANMAIYVVIAVLMNDDYNKGMLILKSAVLIMAIFFMGIWVPEGDGGYSDIFEERYVVTNGSYTGIELDSVDYENNRICYELVNNHITNEDRLYVVNGYAYNCYLDTEAKAGVGQPYSRAGKGQTRVLDYWSVNPENQANYVIVDTANKYYEDYKGGETEEYINSNYEIIDTEGSFTLYKRIEVQ